MGRAIAPLLLALVSGCGRELVDASGGGAAITAEVYWALDPKGAETVTTIRTDTPRVYASRSSAPPPTTATVTFDSP